MPRHAGVPRVIATDLDGTLLRSDGTLSQRTRNALRAVEAAGIEVVFVTARPPRWLDPLADTVGGHGHVICLNGACVYEVATKSVSRVQAFPAAHVAQLVTHVRSGLPGVTLGLERASGAVYDIDFINEPLVSEQSARGRVEDHLDEPVCKLLARNPGQQHDEFLHLIGQIIGDRALLAFSGADGLAEMTAPGVTKATALQQWCTNHGFTPDQVWAFGDMPNDIPMLTWAGTGIAVANAHPDVHAVTSARTASNDDDGVARALEVLLGG